MGLFLQKLSKDASFYGAAVAFPLDVLNLGQFGADTGCYSPPDVTEATRRLGANCGPASFGAVCRRPVNEAMRFFPQFPARDWTTIGDMRRALHTAGIVHVEAGGDLPDFGLALLQFKLNNRPAHPLYSLSLTHWVGVYHGCFYDVNWQGWLPIPVWQEVVLSQMRFGRRPVIGWEVRNSLMVVQQEYQQALQCRWRAGGNPSVTHVLDAGSRP